MNLKEKIALVTGASSGIGEAVAKALAGKGVKVGLAARRTDKLEGVLAEIQAEGGEGIIITMDVTDRNSVTKGVDLLLETYGKIDILINNAGVMYLSDIDALKLDEWEKMVDINIKGILNPTGAVLPHLIAQKSGHIINTSSIAGRKLFQGLGVYCATKHAVAAFSDIMRMEIAPKHHIRVTSIQPGAVATELQQHTTDPKYKEAMANSTYPPLLPEDIASSMLYALEAPDHVDVSEIFILPSEQAW
ncbi:SDR family oxidoreductase [Mucilaginibacter jinjuensis]|uniref:SDR family oxidoreductase n=1 Tax=Mucilaginibacter jinjuensis TaxID=1176721 RepID=A0ABY7TE55_9SPHI|nr:SDR family oxidoreductase [Mucilaginibacter jinjuensis]WCT14316.1 SDR family oxidoreductase [Mucilaginibacter jinjuensis]